MAGFRVALGNHLDLRVDLIAPVDQRATRYLVSKRYGCCSEGKNMKIPGSVGWAPTVLYLHPFAVIAASACEGEG